MHITWRRDQTPAAHTHDDLKTDPNPNPNEREDFSIHLIRGFPAPQSSVSWRSMDLAHLRVVAGGVWVVAAHHAGSGG
jgi:hypothetical protein